MIYIHVLNNAKILFFYKKNIIFTGQTADMKEIFLGIRKKLKINYKNINILNETKTFIIRESSHSY